MERHPLIEKFCSTFKKKYLERYGREQEFIVDSSNEYYLLLMLNYSFNKPEFETMHPREGLRYDLDKGIAFIGDVGVGKTFLMEAISLVFGGMKCTEARWLVRELQQEGINVVDRYGRYSFQSKGQGYDYSQPISLFIDDLGLEDKEVKIYGNQVRTVTDILLDRYKWSVNYKMKTHIASNLDVDTLGEVYGYRLKDRFKEMFNVVPWTGKSRRK